MREFLVYFRKGRTDANFSSLANAGRLDMLHQCAVQALYLAHKRRFDAVFHAILSGPPKPILHIEIPGSDASLPIDELSWFRFLKQILSGIEVSGIKVDRKSLQEIVKEKSLQGYKIFVLEEHGKSVFEEDLSGDVLFVLGDHIGLPKKDERFVLRYGKKISLGKVRYMTSTCIAIINFVKDLEEYGFYKILDQKF